MKKLFTTLLILMVFAASAIAQSNYEEVVYLKNGSVIRGIIVEFVPGVSLKIKSGTNVFFYKIEEIEKITREIPEKGSGANGAGDYGFKSKGFGASYEMGFIAFPGDFTAFSMVLVNGYRFSPHFFMGLGIGAELASGFVSVPAYLDFRAYFLKSRLTPYFDLGLGYNMWSAGGGVLHGFMASPAFGVRVALTQKVGMGLNLGYKYVGIPISNSLVSDGGLTFRIGVEF